MQYIRIILIIATFYINNTSISQGNYNKEKTVEELEKYLDNPKAYFDMIQKLRKEAREASQNNLSIAEEYISQLNAKDSLIEMYKKKAKNSRSVAVDKTTKLTSTANASLPKTEVEKPKTTVEVLANQKMPYRVQIAAFKNDKLKAMLSTPKALMVSSLANRNVFEVAGFQTAEEAFEFSQELRSSDWEGAFVSKYANGVRVEDYDYLSDKPDAYKYKTTKFGPFMNSKNKDKSEGVNYPSTEPNGYLELMGLMPSTNSSVKIDNPKTETTIKESLIKKEPLKKESSNTKVKENIKSNNEPSAPIRQTPKSNTRKDKLDEAFEAIFGS
jgi:hypothetical protein